MMAFGDYHACDKCGNAKTFYDSHMDYELPGENGKDHITYSGHRAWALCPKCLETHHIEIAPNTRPPITDEAIERVARVIAPGHWQVMDSYLAETKRKYAGQNAAYDPDQFKHKESMATARAAIDAFWGGGECHES